MEQGATIRHTVHRLIRLVRLRRAAYYGARGLAWGLGLAILPVALREFLEGRAWLAATALAGGGALAGMLVGALRRVPQEDAAGLADRAFGLHDRLRTGLELSRRAAPGRAPDGLVAAAIDDAAAKVHGLPLAKAVPWRWPREAVFLPAPLLVLAALPYLPAIPVPQVRVPTISRAVEEERSEKPSVPQVADRPVSKKVDPAQRVELQEREYGQRPNPERDQARGDLAAAFKDTSVASKRPDFSSFLKHGDERMRVLERPENLPDLQRDFTQSPYKVMFRKSQGLVGGDPSQVSRERLRQLLDEMNRLGRRASSGGGGGPGGEFGDWAQDAMEGSEALERGQMGRAMDAMERALDKMRAMENRQQGGKGLDGGREREGRGRDGRGAGQPGDGEGDFGEGGSMPGRGTNPSWRGDPSERLGQEPIDMGVEGQLRKGRREAYDTNMLGRGAQNPSRLPYMSVFGQYRKMMEDALAKESIPLDYRSQVKDYFQSLEER